MLKSIALAACATFAVAGAAAAQTTCATYPNTLTNGTTADANQVMANFNCAALLGGANYTGAVTFSASIPYPAITINSAGTAGIVFQHTGGPASSVWNDGNMHIEGQGNLWLNQTSNGNIFMATGGGNVGIGTSSVPSLLTIMSPGNSSSAYVTVLPANQTQSVNIGYNHLFEAGSNGNNPMLIDSQGSGVLLLQNNGGTGYVGINTGNPSYMLYVNGTAYASGAAGALSDARHKDKIQPLAPGALQIVQRLKPVTFVWKDPKDDGMRGEQIGFIAQDVQKTLPDVVLVENNAEKTMGIKYTEIIPVLTAAIQEQQAEIAELRAELAASKSGG
jgi:hypothetical protein